MSRSEQNRRPTLASDLAAVERATQRRAAGQPSGLIDALRRLERGRLATSGRVLRLHEALCRLRAYPDEPAELVQIERMLQGFARRSDLRRHADALADSGIAGTTIHYPFFWHSAAWLGRRWPDRLSLDWEAEVDWNALAQLLPALAPRGEQSTLRELLRVDDLTPREGLEHLRPRGTTDAVFYIRRIQSLPGSDAGREALHDQVSAPYLLQPGAQTPSRTLAKYARAPVVFGQRPQSTKRPDLAAALHRPPRQIRPLGPARGQELIDLAQEAMVTRARDLEAFACADRRDVRLIDDGEGLQFACMGLLPERRLLLPAVYAMLTLRNGVPIGYVQADALFRGVEISYNTFDTFRGGEAAHVFGRVLAACHALLGARSFSIEPYQLGHGNDEGLSSGAWWFYYKLGFRPLDAGVRRLAQRESRRIQRNPGHRSSPTTLAKLARRHLYWGPGTGGHAPGLPRHQHALPAALHRLTRRHGPDLDHALRAAAEETRGLFHLRTLRGLSAAERLAWNRLSPLILALPGLARWSRDELRATADVIRAKGGRHESDFVHRFDAHPRLGTAVRAWLAATDRDDRADRGRG